MRVLPFFRKLILPAIASVLVSCSVTPSGPGNLSLAKQEVATYADSGSVAVFFITGRTAKDRRNTARNLALQGMGNYEEPITRPDGPKDPAADFKSARRREITSCGFTNIANIGDQATDLEGCYAERGFKLPDPFYLIP